MAHGEGLTGQSAIMEHGLENIPTDYCYSFKTVYTHVKETFDRLMNEQVPLSSLNPTVKTVLAKSLARSDGTTKNLLADTYL